METLNSIKNKKKKRNKRKIRDTLIAYAFLSIPIILFSIFFIYGLVRGFIYSLTDYDLRFVEIRGINFNNFENYKKIFLDENVWTGLKVSAIWTFVMLIGNNGFGLLMAVLIVGRKKGQKALLAALYWPALVSAAVGTQITLYLFRPTGDGLMNILFANILNNGEPIAWLQEESTSLISLMIQPFLLGFSTKMLIYYAGLKGIPKMYYEAASIETNSRFKIFWKITFPQLAPVLSLNLILSIIDGFKVLAPMQLVTPGNPYTQSFVYYIYNEAFNKTKIGYASSLSFFLFAIIMIFTLLQNIVKKKVDLYE